MDDHNRRVDQIAAQVAGFYKRKERFRMYHGTTSTTRKTQLSRNSIIDTSRMNHVVKIDAEKQLAIVEPNVSMEQLVDATLAHGLIPPVVMEFPAITVGGGFAGTSGESSSFRHGVFDRTVSRIEIVLANGEVVFASESEREDLFFGAAGSFGTLGVITLLEVRLVPACRFVEVCYSAVGGMEDAVTLVEEMTRDERVEYLEGIMFALDKGVVISGRLVDESDQNLQCTRFSRASDPWFYLHAEKIIKNKCKSGDFRELIPIKDYLFRYDRGAFWAGMWAFKYFGIPFDRGTRWLMDRMLHTKPMYHALHKSRMADQFIVQDIAFPYANVGQFVQFLHQRCGIYPLWLCPLQMGPEISLHPKDTRALQADARSPGMMMNVGVWGPGPSRFHPWVQINREIESQVTALGGLKCFYAQGFYMPEEFWAVYDKNWYDELRSKYHASGLPTIQEKVNVDFVAMAKARAGYSRSQRLYSRMVETWPLRGVYGVLQLFIGGDYLLAKK